MPRTLLSANAVQRGREPCSDGYYRRKRSGNTTTSGPLNLLMAPPSKYDAANNTYTYSHTHVDGRINSVKPQHQQCIKYCCGRPYHTNRGLCRICAHYMCNNNTPIYYNIYCTILHDSYIILLYARRVPTTEVEKFRMAADDLSA